jgi:methionyl-tRNA synthetase
VDQTRFFLMASDATFGGDQDFSHDALIRKCNSNLANEFGNLCQRTLSMAFKNCDKTIPCFDIPQAEDGGDSSSSYTPEDKALLDAVKNLHQTTGDAIATQAIHKYSQALVSMVWDANKYVDEQAPWALKKTDPDRMQVVLYVLLEVIRQIAILYQPLIPTAANKVLDLLAIPEHERTFAALESSPLQQGTSISKPEGVFPRIEVPEPAAVEA